MNSFNVDPKHAQLEHAASRMGSILITQIKDIDVSKVIFNDSTRMVIEELGSQIVINKDGILYTSSIDHRIYRNARRLFAELVGIQPKVMQVKLCTPVVMAEIQRMKKRVVKKNTHIEQDQNSDFSDAQSMLFALIEAGIMANASDIHIVVNDFEHSASMAKVSFRIHGHLVLQEPTAGPTQGWDVDELKALCAVAVNAEAAMSNGTSKHFSTMEPVDASFRVSSSSGERKVRYAQTPTIGGFKAVMRILPMALPAGDQDSIQQLGYRPAQAQLIEESALLSTSGLIIVAGPTGSGKSTTLATLVRQTPQHLSVYTYEDPVEFMLPDIDQVPIIIESKERNWASMSKNSLRLDPDVLMYGELRTGEVAREVVHAATTGHLVYTTLHTNSAVGCITRLHDLGLSYSRLAEPGFLKLLVFQRLIPRVCSTCSLSINQFKATSPVAQRQIERITTTFADHLSSLRLVNKGQACTACGGSGFTGRLMVAEVISIDGIARRHINNGDIANWEQNLHDQSWMSISDHAMEHVMTGLACPMTTEASMSRKFASKQRVDESLDYRDYENKSNINWCHMPQALGL